QPGLAWLASGDVAKDFSFEINGYITEEVPLVEYALSNHDDIKELREANR
ncbi:unnamed protein product, partial [marine sediment metagenome]